ncbi:hypothetical protein [Neorhizobium petrolearium]|uniref:hypothetical protein n=1 Tax=Neorhizobium petrolearium TaxID=515361 RepID=UPI003F7FF818
MDAFELSEFHVLTKRLGQLFCGFGNPRCSECPVRQYCRFAGSVARPAACAEVARSRLMDDQPLVFRART